MEPDARLLLRDAVLGHAVDSRVSNHALIYHTYLAEDSMPHTVNRLIGRVAQSAPFYRFVPPGLARTYAQIRYRGAREDRQGVVDLARVDTAGVLEHSSTAMIAATAAFRTSDDELLETLLDRLIGKFPTSPGSFELRAELRRFQARYGEALNDYDRARLLEPSRSRAVAKVVTFSYLAGADDADQVALDAVRRFPRTGRVWWAAAKSCSTSEQYTRLIATWRELNEPTKLARLVRPLAAAAARAGNVEAACQLFREAITILLDNQESIPAVKATTLEGRGAWSALEALVDVFDAADVPFFFAAGTALGLVREGRPLDLDGDIDVGIFERDWNRDALQKLFETDWRFAPDLLHPYAHKLGLKHRAGSTIDLFRFYEEDGRLWHDSAFTRWHNRPFAVERRTIQGHKLPLPADAETYLTENYGDWRTPNSAFDAFTSDAPNVESTWPEYSRFHLLRRAYAQLSNGDVNSAVADLVTAGEEELSARLEAAHA